MIFIIIKLIINILELLNCSTPGGEVYRDSVGEWKEKERGRCVEGEIHKSKRTTGEGKKIV